MTAVASLQRAQVSVQHASLLRPVNLAENALALQQYGKAMTSLRRRIDEAVRAGRAGCIAPTLLTCMLFVCFEVFQDKNGVAMSHLRHGKDLISGALQNSALDSDSTLITQELNRAFEMLAIASDLCNHRGLDLTDCTHDLPIESISIPCAISSLQEAGAYLDRLTSASRTARLSLLQHARELVNKQLDSGDPATLYCITHCLSRMVHIPSELAQQITKLTIAHKAWRRALYTITQIYERPSHLLDLMRIQHFYSYFTLATCRETEEMLVDRFEDDFAEVLELAEHYLHLNSPWPQRPPMAPTPPRTVEYQRSFSLEKTILPTIHLMGFKCRSPTLRHRTAAFLASAQRREGLLYSGGMDIFINAIKDFEAQRAVDMHQTSGGAMHGSALPEAARFADVVIDLRPDLIRLICARFAHERNGELEITEYRNSKLPLRFEVWLHTKFGRDVWRPHQPHMQ